MGLKWAFFCTEGSPIGVIPEDIYGRGVGGSELALMSLAQTLVEHGEDITVYNDPRTPGTHGGVVFAPRGSYRNDEDVFVEFRTPSPVLKQSKAQVKIFWSCDQYTLGNFQHDIFPYVHRIVCISPYHIGYFANRYKAPADKIGYIDLGVRIEDYEAEKVAKVPNRAIFCSVPDRGLQHLRAAWPMVVEQIPTASLVITADYRLWGSPSPNNEGHRASFYGVSNVLFLGTIPRRELVREQLKAEVMAYPSIYEELMCLALAECQVAGALPITTPVGALPTTFMGGIMMDSAPVGQAWWHKKYADAVAKAMTDRTAMRKWRKEVVKKARDRFDWHKIADQWIGLAETGEFPCG